MEDGSTRSVLYFQGRYFYKITMGAGEINLFLHEKNIPLDTVVLDGRSQHSEHLVKQIEFWVEHPKTNPKSRAISTTSTKLEQGRSHQNDTVYYLIMHSWKIEEFHSALVQEKQLTALYDVCAELSYEEYGIDSLCDEDDVFI